MTMKILICISMMTVIVKTFIRFGDMDDQDLALIEAWICQKYSDNTISIIAIKIFKCTNLFKSMIRTCWTTMSNLRMTWIAWIFFLLLLQKWFTGISTATEQLYLSIMYWGRLNKFSLFGLNQKDGANWLLLANIRDKKMMCKIGSKTYCPGEILFRFTKSQDHS